MTTISRSKAKNIAKQGAILASAGILVRFIGFLYRAPLTDMLGDLGNGIYGSSYYVYMLFLIVSSAGLPAAISKMVAERLAGNKYREAHQIFRVSMVFAVVVGTICMLVLFFGAEYFDTRNQGTRYGLMSLAPTVLIVSIMSVYRGYFQGMKSTVPTAYSQIIEQILNATFSIILCYLLLRIPISDNIVGGSIALGAAGGTMGTGIGAFAGLITLMYIYKKSKRDMLRKVVKDKSSVKSFKRILKELCFTAIPIIAGAAVFSFTNFIDMFMVQDRLIAGGFSVDDATKLYGQLTGKYLVIVALPISISTSLATASIPEIAESMKNKYIDEANEKINTTIRINMIISIPAAVGIGVLSNQILLLLYPRYPDGGLLISVGAISIVFLALTQILGGMMQGLSRFYIPVVAAIVGSFFKLIVNYNLTSIPSINVIGAVIGTIVCYLVASIIDYYALEKITKAKIDFVGSFVKPTFASGMMGMAVYITYHLFYSLFSSNTIGVFGSIFVGVITYFIVLAMINGISEDDMLMLPGGSRVSRILFE